MGASLTTKPLHAGAGGARNQAKSIKICRDICRLTATSAIGKLTWRPWPPIGRSVAAAPARQRSAGTVRGARPDRHLQDAGEIGELLLGHPGMRSAYTLYNNIENSLRR